MSAATTINSNDDTSMTTGRCRDDISAWFGGILPAHPMFFAGWKGNPSATQDWTNLFNRNMNFSFSDELIMASENTENTSISNLPQQQQQQQQQHDPVFSFQRRKTEWIQRLLILIASFSESNAVREALTFEEFDDDKESFNFEEFLEKNISTSVGLAAEILTRWGSSFVTIGVAMMDWPGDWDMSTQLVLGGDGGDNGSAGIFDILPNDSMFPVLSASETLNFINTSRGHPYQWAHSWSDAYHHQCARYLVLGELEPVSYFPLQNTSPKQQSLPLWKKHLQRPYTVVGRYLIRAGENRVSEARNAEQRLERGGSGIVNVPDVFPYTRYLPMNEDDMVSPKDEGVMSLPAEALSMDMAFGFLAVGFDDGILAVFCCRDSEFPRLVVYETASDRFDMFNSVHISRRIVRKSAIEQVFDDDDIDDEFQYEYTLLVTRNSGFVDIHILTPHSNSNSKTQHSDDNKSTPLNSPMISPHHKLATKSAQTMQTSGSAPNDARISPNGRVLVCVGDAGGVWTAGISYVGDDVDLQAEKKAYDGFDSLLPQRLFGQLE
ncbi:hypothetical protein HK100_009325, partial [Physocladia obscura]